MKHDPAYNRTLFAALLVAAAVVAAVPPATAELAMDAEWRPLDVDAKPARYVDVLVPYNGDLYVGGRFDLIGQERYNYIARFDGRNWYDVGGGVGVDAMGLVHAMLIRDDVLYAGGMFDQAGLLPAKNAAVFDMKTEQWLPMGSSLNRPIRDMEFGPDGRVYACGEFSATWETNIPLGAFAVFDGADWQPVGGSFSGGGRLGNKTQGRDIAVLGDDIYVGGYFVYAGEGADLIEVNNIARWDGERFHALEEGIHNDETSLPAFVTAVASYNGSIYVGGQFNRAGPAPANGVARWIPGVGWDTLGLGISGDNSHVRAFYADGNNLYVGGTFTYAGGDFDIQYMARWDGSRWHPMGQLSDQVKAIVPYRETLYIAGNFLGADNTAMYIATWGEPAAVEDDTPEPQGLVLAQNFPNPFNPTTTISFSLDVAADVELAVYDVRGGFVRTLAQGRRDAGPHEIQWDGRDANGNSVATGVYLYRLTTPSTTLTRKMVLLK